PGPPKIVEIVNRVGKTVFDVGAECLNLIGFFGMLIARIAGVLARPSRLPLTSMVYHMEQTGLNAMPIVALLSFLIGVVMAYQGALQLQRFGAELFVVNLLGVSVLRELGILITAIVVAGRSGSAFTAQIGTMKVNQEVDAMETIGIDPIERLVLPRVLALMITLPLLGFMSDIVALVGGALMSFFVLDISFGQFMAQLRSAVDLSHLWVGLIKAPVFAFTIAMVGCYEGLKVGGSAESVGRLTTKSVVESIFLVIVLDALFSILFANLGY
ncbi:MAG: ABC transporter permease, partial [Alphaproteobacteria bacterium]